MNVSLRSQMVAGVAALGATAVAIVPIAQQEVLPSMQRAAAAVQLTGLANPVGSVLGSLGEVNSYLFDTYTFDDAEVTWPDNFYGTYTYAPLNLGIVPDAVNQFSTGALSGLVNNLAAMGGPVSRPVWSWAPPSPIRCSTRRARSSPRCSS